MSGWLSDIVKRIEVSVRTNRARDLRKSLKRECLITDMRDFFDGKKGAEESRIARDTFYAKLDSLSDDELLKMWKECQVESERGKR